MGIKIPKELSRLWINLGRQPLRALQEGTPVVYGAHEAVTFSIGMQINADDVYGLTATDVTGPRRIPHYYLLLDDQAVRTLTVGKDEVKVPVLNKDREWMGSIRIGAERIGVPLRTQLGDMAAEPVTANQLKAGDFFGWFQREPFSRGWLLYRAGADYGEQSGVSPRTWDGRAPGRNMPALHPDMIVYKIDKADQVTNCL